MFIIYYEINKYYYFFYYYYCKKFYLQNFIVFKIHIFYN